MNNKAPHHLALTSLSDEELLKRVFLDRNATPMEMEMAVRLEHALDELAAKPLSMDEVLRRWEANGTNA